MTKGSHPMGAAEVRAARLGVLNRLADDLAHEIKNPLNAVVINLAVLRTRLRKGEVEAALERADVVEAEARRAHDLMDRVLRLARPAADDAGELALDPVLGDVLPLVSLQARLARVPLVVTEPEPGARVVARPATLRSALLALLADAVHATLPGEDALPMTLVVSAAPEEVRFAIDVPGAGVRVGQDAAVLAAACGGRLQRGEGEGEASVTLIVPRAAA